MSKFIGFILAIAVLVLVAIGFSLSQESEPKSAGAPLVVPNSAKSPFVLTASSNHDQELRLLDPRRGAQMLVPSVRAVVALEGDDTYLMLYAYPKNHLFVYLLEARGAEATPVRYWAMNIQTKSFHSLKVRPPAHGALSPDEKLVAYATQADNAKELREIHAISLPLDLEKPTVVLGGHETLTVRVNKYSGEPEADLEWKNDKTIEYVITSTEFPLGDGRPPAEKRTIEVD